jgi:hypothetical protein
MIGRKTCIEIFLLVDKKNIYRGEMTCRQTLVVTGGSVVAILDLYAKWLSTGHVVPPDIHGDERQHGRRPPINM